MTYDPRIKQIVYTPAEEIEQLRDAAPLDSLKSTPLAAGKPVPLKASGACDMLVSVARPTANATISINVGADSSGAGGAGAVELEYVQADGLHYVDVRYVATQNNGQLKSNKGGVADRVPILPSDTTIDIRVFVDGSIGEAYFMGGRVAFLFETPAKSTGFA